MSQENVEIVRGHTRPSTVATSRRPRRRLDRLDFESRRRNAPGAGVHRGHEARAQCLRALARRFDDFRCEIVELHRCQDESSWSCVTLDGPRREQRRCRLDVDWRWLREGKMRLGVRAYGASRGPRSRGPVGVGDVAGERGDRASRIRGVERGDMDASVSCTTPTPSCDQEGWPEPGPFVGREAVMRESGAIREPGTPTQWNRSATSSTPATESP